MIRLKKNGQKLLKHFYGEWTSFSLSICPREKFNTTCVACVGRKSPDIIWSMIFDLFPRDSLRVIFSTPSRSKILFKKFQFINNIKSIKSSHTYEDAIHERSFHHFSLLVFFFWALKTSHNFMANLLAYNILARPARSTITTKFPRDNKERYGQYNNWIESIRFASLIFSFNIQLNQRNRKINNDEGLARVEIMYKLN